MAVCRSALSFASSPASASNAGLAIPSPIATVLRIEVSLGSFLADQLFLVFAYQDHRRHRHAALVGERHMGVKDFSRFQQLFERLGKLENRLARRKVPHPDT